jgi:GTP cyclohydrolase I
MNLNQLQKRRGNLVAIELAIRNVLSAIGEDPDRPGLRETPGRVAKSFLDDLCTGYEINPLDVLKTFEDESYGGIVLVRDIPFVSLCEHHLLIFSGVCHCAYIPNGKIVGLSKIGRVVDAYARRLQVQERLTKEIADCLHKGLDARGVLVTIAAEHTCMSIRGVEKAGALTVTSEIRGLFKTDASAKAEVFQLLNENLHR